MIMFFAWSSCGGTEGQLLQTLSHRSRPSSLPAERAFHMRPTVRRRVCSYFRQCNLVVERANTVNSSSRAHLEHVVPPAGAKAVDSAGSFTSELSLEQPSHEMELLARQVLMLPLGRAQILSLSILTLI